MEENDQTYIKTPKRVPQKMIKGRQKEREDQNDLIIVRISSKSINIESRKKLKKLASN